MSARGKRVSVSASARSLRQKSNEQLEQIALANAHDERALWAVLGVLQERRGSELLKMKIRERLIFKKPLPVPMRQSAIWTTAERRTAERPWYAALGYIVIIAVVVAVARVTEADARLIDAVLDSVRSLGIYLTD